MADPQEVVGTGNEERVGQEIEERQEISAPSELAAFANEAAGAAHVRRDAAAHRWLLASLDAQGAYLERAVRYFRTASGQEALSHAAEWLLDNYHLARQALRQVREDMPRSFYRQLPVLVDGPLSGYPRVYDIAQRLVAPSEARLDLEYARQFLVLYQDIAPLTTGELWALPVMLRLAIIDALTRVLGAITGLPEPPALPALPLTGQSTPDELVGNCFTSLRAIATHDWRRFFEAVSRVEAILGKDPAQIYARMDRETRDLYRKAVEEVAMAAGYDEQAVAERTVALAEAALVGTGRQSRAPGPQTAATPGGDGTGRDLPGDQAPDWLPSPSSHVGYFLLDAGLTDLEVALGYRGSLWHRLKRAARRHPTRVYLGPILLVAVLLIVVGLAFGRGAGATAWQQLLILALSIVPALTVAVSIVDWLATLVVPPRVLPKLDFDAGIPDVFRTLVAVPSLLGSEAEVHALLEQVEISYLANPDPNLAFALLTDPPDADEVETAADANLLELVRAGIRMLNARYGRASAPPFYLLHRERRWNPAEGRWMGWERKRGKLHELNHWLRGAQDTSFVAFEGALEWLRQVRYVITLDADTMLPRDAGPRLVATLAHPLNRAEVDHRSGRVTRGYGILQPRTEITPQSANATPFSRAYSGDIGLDLYTRAVSNVYQDLFGTGIYVGKGIYDVDVFEATLAGRVPENRLLSHDLFEGIHARVGLVTDIVLYEDFPPSYLAYVRRLRRWTRGDWQLLPWLGPTVPAADGHKRNNRFRPIDLWKLFDNLRRSLLPLSLLLLFAAAWLGLAGNTVFWTLAALLSPAVPALLAAATPFLLRGGAVSWRQAAHTLGEGALRWLLAILFLPFEALQLAGAIGRTIVRVLITHRGLLQWTTAAEAVRQLTNGNGRRQAWNRMRLALALTVALGLLIAFVGPQRLLIALPFLIAWLLSPEVAYRISQPAAREPEPLSPQQIRELQTLARRTWIFFERFVGPEEHWLPPDHFQEAPRGVAAPYTSPTNIGMLMLSTLSAYDLGYIGFPVLATRLQYTFDTLGQLERHRGHFLNWYDTRSLEPLLPRYVSTVDSGNLAASLIVLMQALEEVPQGKVLRWVRWEGLANTYSLLDDTIDVLMRSGSTDTADQLREIVLALQGRLLAVRDEPNEWWGALEYVAGDGWQQLEAVLTQLLDSHAASLGADNLRRLRTAIEAIRHQVFTLQRYVNLLLPWLPMLASPPRLFVDEGQPAIRQTYEQLLTTFDLNPVLAEQPEVCREAQEILAGLLHAVQDLSSEDERAAQATEWCSEFASKLGAAESEAEQFLAMFRELRGQADDFFTCMDFGFLFNPLRQVFHIGYNVTAGKLDENFYDLLASEARIASLVALAKHDVPRSHWLHLSRPVTQVDGQRVLLSWSATMFEYLMPALIMRSTPGTLLYESEAAGVAYQIDYARRKGVPWGISESGYYAFDANQNYQYRAFGTPGLGFKRNLAEDLVIAPYASVLALPYRPAEVAQNLIQLEKLGALGVHGFYESIDFTRARLNLGQNYAVVQEYMAHHQGMILVALANRLLNNLTVERFHADPRIRSVDLLLQEKVPVDAPLEAPQGDDAGAQAGRDGRNAEAATAALPWSVNPTGVVPEVHYLSNGRFSTLVTAAGAGFSCWQGSDLTRWRADTTLENWGQWIYVQDRESGDLWSAGLQPTGVRPDSQATHFYPHMAEFRRTDHGISVVTEVLVAPDDDAHISRLTVLNESDRPRRLSLTSYAELVLAEAGGDIRHPAFNKLFIESEYLPEPGALLFRRRLRTDKEATVFLLHLVAGERGAVAPDSYESDRAAFLGRGGNVQRPAALLNPLEPLGGGTGATLDPIAALQVAVELEPGERKQLSFLTVAAAGRAAAVETANRLAPGDAVANAFEQARARTEVELTQLGLSTMDLQRIQSLLAVLLYPHAALRSEEGVLAANTKGQSALWAYGISGDYPILLVRVHDEDDLPSVGDLLQAQTYWRRRLLKIDLVILVDKEAGYSQELRDELHRLLAKTQLETWLNQRGGIFILYTPQLPEPDRALILTAARAVVNPSSGSLAMQLEALHRRPGYPPEFAPERSEGAGQGPAEPLSRPEGLLFDNGLGGFAPGGREYVLYLAPGQKTPAPWVNVLANPEFGSLVSESGSSCTWAVNSGENRLTPWSNDPVGDPSGEILYLRDEETGEVWSPTPAPCAAPAPYLVRHGQGQTVFEHDSHGLHQTLRHFVAHDDPVKVVMLRVENHWPRPRRLTATFYVEWVLGVTREPMQQYVTGEYDGDTQAMLARNPYNAEFGERVAFVVASKRLHGATADRAEFLGRLGNQAVPAALANIGLGGTLRAGLDPCAALQVHLDLQPDESEEIWFVLGQGADRADAVRLAGRYKEPEQVEAALRATVRFWDDLLSAVQVYTPDPGMDLLLNRWLPYQALACRIWGRTAFYQSSGAFGFRDQLQDVMAMVHAAPHIAREQIIDSARHQFEAGDVLHWWHPPSGRGVRTHCSDDLLWLPFVTAHYIETTGDTGILDETVTFLRAAPLEPGIEERYGQFPATAEQYSLFEHCRRAIEKGATAGAHGLPLIGSGDWNDGMNRVGIEGRGESVWLGWFLHATLTRFGQLASDRGDERSASSCQEKAERLAEALQANAWDGEWFLRAFYDDGTPLGSAQDTECRIDAIAQSWAVLSGAGEPDRAQQAMAAVRKHLVRPDEGLLLLFTPPFDRTPRDPGYIKGYLPGIRENGGQYTHAAVWSVWAFAEVEGGRTAVELFRLLNPIHHADTPEKVDRYKVEPYVIAADVYSVPPHTGRGGWTWYTGSSGWMYRLGLEGILGVQRKGDALVFEPHIPPEWEGFTVEYRFGESTYRICVGHTPAGGEERIVLDGQELQGGKLPLASDGGVHEVEVWLHLMPA